MKCLVLAAMLAMTIPAHADLYKCKGADGKTTYQDAPCLADGLQLNIHSRPTSPTYGETDSDRRAQRDIDAARQLDRDRELRKIQADSDRRTREYEKQAKAERCARYETSAARAKYWADRAVDSSYRDLKQKEADSYSRRYSDECR